MKKLILLLCLLPKLSSAQKIIIGDKEGDRPLIWDDFKGKPDKESKFEALTNWTVNWNYAPPRFSGDTAFVEPIVEVFFNKGKSWIRKEKETDELLKHEQIHFDIAKLFGFELYSTFTDTVLYRKDFRAVMYSIHQRLFAKYNQMQQQYDKETDHSKNKEEQKRWNTFIEQALAKYTGKDS